MLKALGDPYFVAKFQRTFGLREVRSEENGNSLHDFKDPVSELQYGHVVANNGYQRNHAHSRSKLNSHSIGLTREEAPEKLAVPGEQKVKQTYEFNSFFHVLFAFGSTLGYESFYITFFPFLFWNIDEYLARRIVFMWALIMYIGQAAKDVIQWPRPPCPPVISVEKRFQVEYGMPSTHAMVGTLIPVCIVYFTYDRYQYPLYLGILFAICWCVLVSSSRLYMGMHTLQDILAGIFCSVLLLVTVLPLMDISLDRWAFSSPNTPIFLTTVPLAMIILYPSPPKQTRTKADTAMIIFGTCGALLGNWARCYFQGVIQDPYLGTPYPIRIPGLKRIIQMLCKFVLGVTVMIPTRAVAKSTVHTIVPLLLAETDPQRKKAVSEMPHKCFTYMLLGITAVGFVPQLFAYFDV